MTISRDEVLYVAHLARLDIKDDEMERLGGQIDDILNYVEKLKQADTKGVDPTSQSISIVNRLREDMIVQSIGAEKAVLNAPESNEGLFVVPKVINN